MPQYLYGFTLGILIMAALFLSAYLYIEAHHNHTGRIYGVAIIRWNTNPKGGFVSCLSSATIFTTDEVEAYSIAKKRFVEEAYDRLEFNRYKISISVANDKWYH